jgi:histidinol-phosphate aminotransferase
VNRPGLPGQERESNGGARFVRPSLEQIPASEPAPLLPPGTVSLGLNEGLSGPFPAALRAIAEAVPRLNRYPGRGSAELVEALAERHEVPTRQVVVAAGADALIGYVCQAVLQPGDEVVIPWPSFPSFVRDAQKRDAVPVLVPLVEGVVDTDAVREAVTSRTRIVFVATPNNPTGKVVQREELTALITGLPAHVLPVLDEAYIDYLEPGARFDAVADLVLRGYDVLALRTFSKLYGLAGLRVGYGVGPAAVVAAMRKVQRGYDVGALAQVAALASLHDDEEVVRRRAANREAMAALDALVRARGLVPLPASATNFLLVDVGLPADAAAATLLLSGVAVQSGAPFGAPTSLRIGAGSEAELARLDAALAAAGFSTR